MRICMQQFLLSFFINAATTVSVSYTHLTLPTIA